MDASRADWAELERVAGLIGKPELQIAEMASRSLILQRFVFAVRTWSQINNNRARICDMLSDVYPGVSWNEITVADEPIWKFVNRLNNSIHSTLRTPGGAKYRAQVICCQGGEFCMLCGNRGSLQVDHIIAVNSGGEPNNIRNMQLLCEMCNSGKLNVADYDVRVALRIADKECNQLRYRILVDRGTPMGRSVMGCCQECHATSRTTELKVVKLAQALSYSYSNLKVVCSENHR